MPIVGASLPVPPNHAANSCLDFLATCKAEVVQIFSDKNYTSNFFAMTAKLLT